MRQLGPVTYELRRNERSRPWMVHVDRLKPCHQPDDKEAPPPMRATGPENDTSHDTDHDSQKS